MIINRRELESLILPVVLLLTGLILIGGDHVGILSLDRIENLWPVSLILVGLSDLLSNSGEEQGKLPETHTTRERAKRV